MRSHELKKAKRAVRRAIIARRDAMPPGERLRDGVRVVERFLTLEEVAVARTVAAFWSFGSEVPTEALLGALHARGIRVALPRIVGEDLELRSWAPGDPMAPTSFGAMEPVDGEQVEPREVDVVCTPAVAFDLDVRRVGYGGGYYDRLFASIGEALRVGIAFDLQVVDGPLPNGHFDRGVHVVVTPTRVVRVGGAT